MKIVVCLVLFALWSSAPGEAANKPNIAEVLFVIDQRTVDSYKGYGYRTNTKDVIREELQFYIGQVNELLQTLNVDGGANIRVVPLDIMFLNESNMILDKSDIGSDGWTVSVDTYLKKFASWTSKLKTPDFDMAVLLTRYYMTRGKQSVQGLAYRAGLCHKYYATSVVYSDGSTLTASHIAHEIGHILGSPHDDVIGCKQESDSVMVLRSRYRTHFSSCSRQNISAILTRIKGRNCMLRNADPKSAIYTAPSKAPTDLLNPHKLCERKYGRTGTMCLTSRNTTGVFPSGSRICQRVECCFPGEGYWGTVQATNGEICGKNQRCHMGVCKKVTPDVSFGLKGKCLFGDAPYIRYNGKVQSCGQAGKEACSEHSSECCVSCRSNLG